MTRYHPNHSQTARRKGTSDSTSAQLKGLPAEPATTLQLPDHKAAKPTTRHRLPPARFEQQTNQSPPWHRDGHDETLTRLCVSLPTRGRRVAHLSVGTRVSQEKETHRRSTPLTVAVHFAPVAGEDSWKHEEHRGDDVTNTTSLFATHEACAL